MFAEESSRSENDASSPKQDDGPSTGTEVEVDHTERRDDESILRIAVAGCSHGEMDMIYERLAQWEQQGNFKADLLICCGDYESIRNYADLEFDHSVWCPPKYRDLHSFHRYYSGELLAPVLTLFIGGNHEATAYLSELPYGGWVAPRIYYMGYASVVNFRGLRIAGLSGIYKNHDYSRGHFEVTPYDANTMRSAYHVRSLEIFRLRQLLWRDDDETKRPLDICISHDWPTGVHRHGDEQWLLNWKRHFADDIANNTLGNPHTETLLNELQPRYWFSAHLHVMFKALVRHNSGRETRFLALDKPLPRRHFLYVEEIAVPKALDDGVDELSYDAVWLAILRSTDHLWHLHSSDCYIPSKSLTTTSERNDFRPTEEEIQCVRELLNNDLRIPENFRMTGPPHQPHETAKMFRNCLH